MLFEETVGVHCETQKLFRGQNEDLSRQGGAYNNHHALKGR